MHNIQVSGSAEISDDNAHRTHNSRGNRQRDKSTVLCALRRMEKLGCNLCIRRQRTNRRRFRQNVRERPQIQGSLVCGSNEIVGVTNFTTKKTASCIISYSRNGRVQYHRVREDTGVRDAARTPILTKSAKCRTPASRRFESRTIEMLPYHGNMITIIAKNVIL